MCTGICFQCFELHPPLAPPPRPHPAFPLCPFPFLLSHLPSTSLLPSDSPQVRAGQFPHVEGVDFGAHLWLSVIALCLQVGLFRNCTADHGELRPVALLLVLLLPTAKTHLPLHRLCLGYLCHHCGTVGPICYPQAQADQSR